MPNPNSANFPTSLPTDSTLLVAAERVQTSLASSITAVASKIVVVDSSQIPYPSLVLIDDEEFFVASVTAGNVLNVLRGFNGTTAANHNSGSIVRVMCSSYHHNQIAVELQAVCNSLGINLSNVIRDLHIDQFPADIPSFLTTATLANVTGTHVNTMILRYAHAQDQALHGQIVTPPDWDLGLSLEIRWKAGMASGNVVWGVDIAKASVGDGIDPTLSTTNTATVSVSNAEQIIKTTISNISVSNAVAGDGLFYKLYRNGSSGNDTMLGNADIVSVRWILGRH